MKTIFTSLLLLSFSFQDCFAQPPSITADSLSKLLLGKWEAAMTCGGIAGGCRPTNGSGQSIEFKELTPQSFYYEQSSINSAYHWYFMQTSTAGETVDSLKDFVYPFDKLNMPTYVDVVSEDTIWIGGDCIDCSSTQFARLSVVTSSNEKTIFKDSMTFGPNPFSDRLVVSPVLPNSTLRFMDLQGRVLLELEHLSPSGHVEVSSLPSGVFVLELSNGESTIRKNVVKK